MQYHVITIGNAVIDAFLFLPENNTDLSFDRENNKLCVTSGKKILLEECIFVLGGNACNVAVGMSRLGLKSALLAEIGSDEFAQKILHGLNKEHVGVDLLIRGEGQSSFSLGINFQGERTLFIEHRDREHDFILTSLDATYFYLTSLGSKWEHVYKRMEDVLQSRPHQKLAFNPGSMQIKAGLPSFEYLLPFTSILFLNRDEAELLLGRKADTPELMSLFQKKGVKTVVITDGENGSMCLTESGEVLKQDMVKCTVVERTGAGDAFATGFLAAIISGKDEKEALFWGAKNASSVIEQIGSQKGLLTREKI